MERIKLEKVHIDPKLEAEFKKDVLDRIKKDKEVLLELEEIFLEFETYLNEKLTQLQKDQIILANLSTIHERLKVYTDQTKKYKYRMTYDFNSNCINLKVGLSSKEEAIVTFKNNIVYSFIDKEELSKIFEAHKENFSQVKNKIDFYNKLRIIYQTLFRNKEYANYFLESLRDNRIIAIRFFAALCAKNEKIAHIDAGDFFHQFISMSYKDEEEKTKFFEKIKNVPVLFIEDIDNFPFSSLALVDRYLVPLLSYRDKNKLVTFISSSIEKDELLDLLNINGLSQKKLENILKNYKNMTLNGIIH